MPARRRRHPRVTTAPPGDVTLMRQLAAVVVTAWDGWAAGPQHTSAATAAVAEQIDALRTALANPDQDRFAAAVTGLLGGVPAPSTAQPVRAATQRLRRAAYPLGTDLDRRVPDGPQPGTPPP